MNFNNDFNLMKQDLINSLELTPEQQARVNDFLNRNFVINRFNWRIDAMLLATYQNDATRIFQHAIRDNAYRIATTLTQNYILSLEQTGGPSPDSMHYASFEMPLYVMKRTKPDGTR